MQPARRSAHCEVSFTVAAPRNSVNVRAARPVTDRRDGDFVTAIERVDSLVRVLCGRSPPPAAWEELAALLEVQYPGQEHIVLAMRLGGILSTIPTIEARFALGPLTGFLE